MSSTLHSERNAFDHWHSSEIRRIYDRMWAINSNTYLITLVCRIPIPSVSPTLSFTFVEQAIRNIWRNSEQKFTVVFDVRKTWLITAGGSYHLTYYFLWSLRECRSPFCRARFGCRHEGKTKLKMVPFILERNQFANGWVETWPMGRNHFVGDNR